MKKLIIGAGLVLFFAGIWLTWRSLNPPLTDEQQIAAHLETAMAAINRKSWRTLNGYMTEDFRYSTMSRKDVMSALTGFSFQLEKITLNLSGVKLKVGPETAESSGHYSLVLQAEPASPGDVSSGDFKFLWRKEEGQWKVYRAETTR